MKFLKWLFFRKRRNIVWHEQSEYSVTVVKKNGDEWYTARDNFNYVIYYYPFRFHSNYTLECFPEYLNVGGKEKSAITHRFYVDAMDKLRQFESGSLIEQLILQD
jgi:hypothetical protein